MGKMVANFAEVGLVALAITLILFNITMWCHTSTSHGYMFTMLADRSTKGIIYGSELGGTYILFSLPMVLLAMVATTYLAIKQRNPSSFHVTLFGRFWRLLWTRPLFVNKIMGILNGFDMVVIFITIFMILWMFLNEYLPQARIFDAQPGAALLKWKQAAIVLGRVSVLSISMLFIPISRSSPILRMIDIPFEQAVRYHTWLGHLTMIILSGHVGIFIGIFAHKHHMMSLFHWPHSGVSILAGLIAFLAGISMWITAFSYVRSCFFNLFYYVHQLYWIFFAFFVYHVGIKTGGYYMGSVFLYFIDRFFRFCQSRKKMFISSAKILPNEVVELKIPKSSYVKYNAISFFFINIPSISSLEWHPFSVASSPLDENKDITIYIKPCGITSWTQHLHTLITRSLKNNKLGCPFSTKFSMEGPYGHESDYFLRYNTLLLIAGGIGITPFLAVISDILYRYELGKNDLPQYVHLIWIVRRSEDLNILQQLSPTSIFPNYQPITNLTLLVDVYVTKGDIICNEFGEDFLTATQMNNTTSPPKISVSISHNLWMLLLIFTTTFATFTTFRFFEVYIIDTQRFAFGTNMPQWIRVSLFLTSLLIGVVGMGGFVITCWKAYFNYKKSLAARSKIRMQQNSLYEFDIESDIPTLHHQIYTHTHRGRPNFREIFDTIQHRLNTNVGVLVSGPEGLQLDIANECRNHPSNNYSQAHIFNYHSVSFSL